MAHLVAFYPDKEASLRIAASLIQGGASFLEVQFPFSDPTADGATIQEACTTALANGFKVDLGFELVKQIHGYSPLPLFIMSYSSLVYSRGIANFLAAAQKAGAKGLIVPDLPFDCDEGLYTQARALGLEVIPVVAPTISEERLTKIASLGTTYIYAALRKGITGAFTEIGQENLEFLSRTKALGFKVLAGFGISTREQIKIIAPLVEAAIVGSAFIREIQNNLSSGDYANAVLNKMKELADK
jgi:tryptophan synthase alpha chain